LHTLKAEVNVLREKPSNWRLHRTARIELVLFLSLPSRAAGEPGR
jgi:hypothetical protein